MWTMENRKRYDRSGLRYESDLTDAEWALVASLIPAAKRGGNKRRVWISGCAERGAVCAEHRLPDAAKPLPALMMFSDRH